MPLDVHRWFPLAGVLTLCALMQTTPALATPGDLDPSFGTGGIATTDLHDGPGSADDHAQALAVQADGKFVVVGDTYSSDWTGFDFGLARYLPNGELDPSFSDDGKVATDLGTDQELGEAVAVQSDGRILLGGFVYTQSGGNDFAVARYNADGTLDASFGSWPLGGIEVTDLGGNDFLSGMALQPDGRIVVVGSSDSDVAIARYNRNGLLDPTFSGDGRATLDLGGTEDAASAVQLQSDGRSLVAGNGGDPQNFTLLRYNADGTLDASFGSAGRATADFGMTSGASSLALEPDGRIVVAGNASSVDFPVARFAADGTLDRSFSDDGMQTTYIGGGASAAAVILQSDGKLLLAGQAPAESGTEPGFAVVRLDASGTRDPQFSGDGVVTTPFGGTFSSITGAALTSDGRLLTTGTTCVSGGASCDVALARYLTGVAPVDATPPTIAISTPRDGQHFGQRQSVASSYGCDDGPVGSGVATCIGPPTVDTSTPGPHSFTVDASDHLGNATRKAVQYVVDAPPMDNPPVGGSSPPPTVPGVQPRLATPTLPKPRPRTAAPKAAKPRLSIAGRLTKANLRRGLKVSISGVRAGSRILVELRAGRTLLLTKRLRAGRSGGATITLKLNRAGLRRARGTLRVRVQAVGHDGRAVGLTGVWA